MERHKYLRVSSEAQDFAQQDKCINDYLIRIGIDPALISSVWVEKVSGRVDHTERKLAQLINKCDKDDVIYISELSRLGRNMTDLFKIVSECCAKGIAIIQCKDGTQIENNSIGGKALLFALGIAAEIEVANIRQRTRMGLAACREELKTHGKAVSKKSGREYTHFGNAKGCDTSAARKASIEVKRIAAQKWREESKAYALARVLFAEGASNKEIVERMAIQYQIDPDNYCGPQGGPVSANTICKWKKEFLEDPFLLKRAAMA